MEADLDKGTLTCMSKGLEIPKEMDSAGSSSAPLVKTEAIANCSLLVEVKQEHEDLSWDTSMENIIASTSVKKVEPDWNQAETEYHTENIFIYEQSKPDPNLLKLESTLGTDLDRSEDASPKEMEVSVKTETTETVFKSEENPDIAEFNIKHEQLDLKDDLEQNQIIMLSTGTNPKKLKPYKKYRGVECDNGTQKKNQFTMQLLKGQNPEDVALQCDKCDFKTIYKRSLKRHSLQHADRKALHFFKCGECEYQTLQRSDLNRHMWLHKNLKEVAMLKCSQCEYTTVTKARLKAHVVIHRERKEANMFRCDQCDFKTIRKSGLTTHFLLHRDPDEVNRFKCSQCEYTTITKARLRAHAFIHQERKEANMFHCDQCDFKTTRKRSLITHFLLHKDPDEVNTFKCSQCEYTTITKARLKDHGVVHQEREEANMFRCDQCDFKTIRKRNLTRHFLRHKDPIEVDTFNSNQCEYAGLNTHVVIHQERKEANIFRCDQCDFKTVYKSSLKAHFLRHKGLDKADEIKNTR